MENALPIFLHNLSNRIILNEIKELIPENTKVYLFGGTIRNAIHFNYFKEKIKQRDFDCIVIGDGELFAQNLLKAGFVYGSKDSEKSKVLKKARILNPVDRYNDFLYLDCKIFSSSESIESTLERISDFTIGAVALDIKEIDSINWLNKVSSIEDAVLDIKNKKLKIIKSYPANLYKMIRLVSQGYQLLLDNDVEYILEKAKDITEEKFKREVEKTSQYVGGAENVLEIARGLGITKNILDFESIKK